VTFIFRQLRSESKRALRGVHSVCLPDFPCVYSGIMADVTRILNAIEEGDPRAAEQLLPLVYDELRRLAAQRLAQEQHGQTLQPTALVHEAYLRLVGAQPHDWNGRGHFFAAAAEAMRRILVDNARRRRAEKHGGGRQRLDLADVDAGASDDGERWLFLDDALTLFAKEDPAAAHVARLRLFASLSVEEAAAALGISRATAFRHWTYARAWLQATLTDIDSSK
jgi:RNA polymerase sigma factor (TIGR02999 family)